MLYDELRRFVGVLIPRVDGVPLGAFTSHAELLKKQFPLWTRYDLIKLCLHLAESVHTLHRHGVILGDLHPGNVIVSDNDSVCWVDVDSMQIEDYPCTVGTERFRAPELHGNYGGFLRTCSHDAYALSVLLFMTLTLGLSPFSRQGEEGDMRESARKGEPPYAFASYKPPAGIYPPDTPGRYVWSYLPRKLRDDLGHNLTCVQRRDLRPRVMPGYLARCLQQYLRDMEPGGRRNHPMYRDLLHDSSCPPPSLLEKMTPNICSDCGIRFREAMLKRLADADLSVSVDDERIIREVALFADKCDISEEITRLSSHFDQFRTLCGSSAPAGRPLDFLCQEIFREFNTIGSKANDSTLAHLVVAAKTELEKIREQVQNIE